MAYEIELKARVEENELDRVKSAILALPGVKELGNTSKFDIYWSYTEDGDPVFRTRREMTENGPDILFTAKPSKTKSEKGTEENHELEFNCPDTQWDRVLAFWSGIGFQVCRLKWKKGTGYRVMIDGFDIHIELLNIRFLGWYLEMEICPETLEGFDKDAADKVLRKILALCDISEDAVEVRGYNKMLKEIGKDRG